MASRREDLHEKLIELLGSTNVYYQSPESINMKYPAIRYVRKNINKLHANNATYQLQKSYEITLIDFKPDSEYIDKILQLPYTEHDRHYKAENLNHDVFTIYY